MDLKVSVVVLVAACSGKTKGALSDDARHTLPEPVTVRDAAVPIPTDGKGDVQIRVEWKDVPIAARQSPGVDACGAPHAPWLAPTTTWGIPDVVVMIDAPGTVQRPPRRITVDRCQVTPRVVVAGTHVIVTSTATEPKKPWTRRVSPLPLGSDPVTDPAKTIYLPIAGHSVDVSLPPKFVNRLDSDGETTWILTTDSPFAAITEANGQVVLRDVPSGKHDITAWLPGFFAQPQHLVRGTVTVTPGGLAEVTLDISK